MVSNTWLADQVTLSPTRALSILRPKGGGGHSVLIASLMLTSLIDAFSILVIFLLMNTSSTYQEFEMKVMNGLPTAANADVLKKGVVLVVEGNQYKINDRAIPLSQLTRALKEEKAKLESEQLLKTKPTDLIIQASGAVDYQLLSPILVAASEASFQHYKLAVLEANR